MDFDTVHRDNLVLNPKISEECFHIPTMKYDGVFPLGFSSSSNDSGRFSKTFNHHPNILDSGTHMPFHDPFDPFQASYNGMNQYFNILTSFARDINGAPIAHGMESTRVLDLGSGTCFDQRTDQSYHIKNSLLDANGIFEMDSRLVLDDGAKQDTMNIKHDEAKSEVQKKRKRIVDKKSEIIKGQWTSDEDRLLVELVEKYGVRKWSSIAQLLPGRIGKQCRERWHNHLKPNIKKDRWSEEEDRILIEAHKQLGNKWAEIARSLPQRSENTIKNHWNATKRQQLSSRKKSNSKKKTTSLHKYIKSLISSSSSSSEKENYSSSNSNSLFEDEGLNLKQENNCSKLNIAQRYDVVQEILKFDLQKEIDFMEMLSSGYI